jgi:hypothetical protein
MKLPALSTTCPQERLFSIKHLSSFQHQSLKKLATIVFNFYAIAVLLTRVCECGFVHMAPCGLPVFTPTWVYCCENLCMNRDLSTPHSNIGPF